MDLVEHINLMDAALDVADLVVERAKRVRACSPKMKATATENLLRAIENNLAPALDKLPREDEE